MNFYRYFKSLTIVFCFLLLQSCGNAKTDTNGSLSLSEPTLKANGDGTYAVSTTATYTTPVGKVPNGVVIHFTETENGIEAYSFDDTLTSSNSVIRTFIVNQSTSSSVRVGIIASIGDMTSSVLTVVPALAGVNSSLIQFLQTDPAGTTKTTTITGGIAPYSLLTVSTADLNVSLSGATFSVTTINVPGISSKTQNFTIRDSMGNSGTVQVNYF